MPPRSSMDSARVQEPDAGEVMREAFQSRGLLIRLLGMQEIRFEAGDLVVTPDDEIGAITHFEMRAASQVWVFVLITDGWGDWYDLRFCRHA
jgi:hypothetical protein